MRCCQGTTHQSFSRSSYWFHTIHFHHFYKSARGASLSAAASNGRPFPPSPAPAPTATLFLIHLPPIQQEDQTTRAPAPCRRRRLRAEGGAVASFPPAALLGPGPRGHLPHGRDDGREFEAAGAGDGARQLPRRLVLGRALAALLRPRRLRLLRPQPLGPGLFLSFLHSTRLLICHSFFSAFYLFANLP